MKLVFKSIVMLLISTALCVNFTSCSKDDDEDRQETNDSNNSSDNDDDEEDLIRCNACKGTGICPNCDGDGEVLRADGKYHNCGYCGNWNGTCPTCAGEGWY